MGKQIKDFQLKDARASSDLILLQEGATNTYKSMQVGNLLKDLGSGGGGGGLAPWQVVTSNYLTSNGDRIVADLSNNSLTITLPAQPTLGTEIEILAINISANRKLSIDGLSVFNSEQTTKLAFSKNLVATKLIFINTTIGWIENPSGILFNAALPPQINLVAWWEADYGVNLDTTNTVTVREILDRSGNSLNTLKQATKSLQPQLAQNVLNGKPVFRFTGNGYLSTSDVNCNVQTLLVVYAHTNYTNYDGIIANRKTDLVVVTGVPNSNKITMGDNLTEVYLNGIIQNNANAFNYQVGIETGAPNRFHLLEIVKGGVVSSKNFTIGADIHDLNNRRLKGDIAAIMLYSSQDSATRVAAKDYLKNKYALSV